MGIDAEMLVRGVPAATVTDDWLRDMSWRLCQSIGASHFKVGEYWRGCGDDYNALMRSGRYAGDGEEIVRGSVYIQDGPDVLANAGECMLEVGLMGRYYGVGYERGDLLVYCAIAEWLEINIPGCVVYYGGDSSGVCAEPFDAAARLELRKHLFSQEGRDYFNYHQSGLAGDAPKRPPACRLCPGGVYRGSQYGWGGTYAAFSCAGCGDRKESRDGCLTWQKPEKDA